MASVTAEPALAIELRAQPKVPSTPRPSTADPTPAGNPMGIMGIGMMLAGVAGALDALGKVYSSAFCSKATSQVASCQRQIKELDTVINYCLANKKDAGDQRIKNGINTVRDRYNELRNIYNTRSKKWDACYPHVRALGTCLDDFASKLEQTDTYCSSN